MNPALARLHQLFPDRFSPDTLDGCPILELGARVWDPERYHAFKICYQTMRWVDDLVDHRKSSPVPLAPSEKEQMRQAISAWMLEQESQDTPLPGELRRIRDQFQLPAWPWQRWTRAMLYDLDHQGFATFKTFLRYSEGAAVAPGAIFMHLCAVTPGHGSYVPPSFDIRRAARPLALFAYLVHILRDFKSDHQQNLNYFSEDLLKRHGLDRASLRAMAEGSPLSPGFRDLAQTYHRAAEYYRRATRQALDQIQPGLESPYALSLDIIYELYLQIHEKTNPAAGEFTEAELVPTCPEVLARIAQTVEASGFQAPPAVAFPARK